MCFNIIVIINRYYWSDCCTINFSILLYLISTCARTSTDIYIFYNIARYFMIIYISIFHFFYYCYYKFSHFNFQSCLSIHYRNPFFLFFPFFYIFFWISFSYFIFSNIFKILYFRSFLLQLLSDFIYFALFYFFLSSIALFNVQ